MIGIESTHRGFGLGVVVEWGTKNNHESIYKCKFECSAPKATQRNEMDMFNLIFSDSGKAK
eukprot:108542-Amphidinium_carterae.1